MTEQFDPMRSCRIKARYPTELVAESVAVKVRVDRGTLLRVYACSECGGYHLTHQNVHVPEQKPGWREPKLSQRQEAALRKRDRKRGMKRGRY